jgi:putative ABC transport system permease protein
MTGPRWRKVLADLTLSRARTVLVVLSIAIGVFAVGSMLTSRVVLERGINDAFGAANSASAVLLTEPFGPDLVEAAKAQPGIADAEGRATLPVRLQTGDDWSNLRLNAIADFDDIRIDRVISETGSWPPAAGEVVLERASIGATGAEPGDQVVIETPDGARHTLTVSGAAWDPGTVDPATADGTLYGYIRMETLAALGQPETFNELHLVAADTPHDLTQGELIAGLVRDEVLEPAGVAVHRTAVHDTPRYHATQLTSALSLIFTLLGGLVLLLGVFLVVNTVSALLAQQVRQIDIMKAIGGRRRQIVLLYLGLVLAYGVIGAAIALPLAALGAWAFSGFIAGMLNVDASGPRFPPSVVAIEIGLALLVPLLSALAPVLRGTRLTVREALTSYGLANSTGRAGIVECLISRLRGVSRPVLLALRNTFRRRGRLALTLATLTLGGALFASVTSINASLNSTLDEVIQYFDYDVELTMQNPEPVADAVREAEAIPGVDHAEGWIATNASRVRPDGTQNSNVWVMAAPVESGMVKPTLVEGRWVQPGEAALVVNVDFQGDEPDIGVGDTVTLRMEGHEVRWPVVGVITSQMMGPVVFAPYETLSEALGMSGEANRIVLDVSGSDAGIAQVAEQRLRESGLSVVQVQTRNERIEGTQGLFDILVMLLMVVGGLLVVVGSLGLAGAMSLNVLERRREIGVMRAIGASNRTVARIVVVEGLAVGLLSWLLGALLALPLSWALGNVIGVAFMRSPLAYTFSIVGVLLWLVLVVVLSVIASVLPARGAWRLSVREVLAYE